jgi:hypothetical protein
MYKFQRRKSKYGNKKTEYNGVMYASKKEAAYAGELDLRVMAGDIRKWNRQVKLEVRLNGQHICNYYADFQIVHTNNTVEYVDVKGYETKVFKLKWKLVQALYGSEFVNFTIVK